VVERPLKVLETGVTTKLPVSGIWDFNFVSGILTSNTMVSLPGAFGLLGAAVVLLFVRRAAAG
jgi:hypothetical protein